MGLYGCFLLVVIACDLPGAFASGAASTGGSCLAAPIVYGPTCNSNMTVMGSRGYRIVYSVYVIGKTFLCCDALTCSQGSCSLVDAGCGTGSWNTLPLEWGIHIATPRIKCKGFPLGSSYRFTH